MRPQVMGVLNVTPDSFSDGGKYFDPELAVNWGLQMAEEGADIIDVGGESSRPGSEPVPAEEELRRVLPVVTALSPRTRVSIDTAKAAVAEAALEAGASIVNDITASWCSGAAEGGAGWVALHMQGVPRTMQQDPRYSDVVGEVSAFLVARAEEALAAGITELWVDPGIGFGKTTTHNLALLKHIGRIVELGYPVMVGASRKSFIGQVIGSSPFEPDHPGPVAVDDRLAGSLAAAVWAMGQGVAAVRVHDVAPTAEAAILVGAHIEGSLDTEEL